MKKKKKNSFSFQALCPISQHTVCIDIHTKMYVNVYVGVRDLAKNIYITILVITRSRF